MLVMTARILMLLFRRVLALPMDGERCCRVVCLRKILIRCGDAAVGIRLAACHWPIAQPPLFLEDEALSSVTDV